MEPINISTREAIIYWVLINPGVGFVLGLIPLIAGYFKAKIRTGIYGLVVCTVGGAILGMIISIPAMAIFTWLIVRDRFVPTETEAEEIEENEEN